MEYNNYNWRFDSYNLTSVWTSSCKHYVLNRHEIFFCCCCFCSVLTIIVLLNCFSCYFNVPRDLECPYHSRITTEKILGTYPSFILMNKHGKTKKQTNTKKFFWTRSQGDTSKRSRRKIYFKQLPQNYLLYTFIYVHWCMAIYFGQSRE